MKQQQCWFSCDARDCDETSSPGTRWPEARSIAKGEGWRIMSFPGGYDRPSEIKSYCPTHK